MMPVYDDWQCAQSVIEKLDALLADIPASVRVLLLDDGSSTPAPEFARAFSRIEGVECLRLRRNLGHQRAIAIGLCFLLQERESDAVVVMDADGEDRPEDVAPLVEKFCAANRAKVVFAARTRRSESLTFRVFYRLYCLLHRALTGIAVKVGNFSILSREHIATLSVVSEMWNHYAASVYKARLTVELHPTSRGKRLGGQSKLNFVSLSIHGLSAISVFAETVGMRLILAACVLMVLAVLLVGAVIGIRFGTSLAIPGWATMSCGILLLFILQMLTLAVGLTFSILFNRNNLTFVPIRDYRHFIAAVSPLYER